MAAVAAGGRDADNINKQRRKLRTIWVNSRPLSVPPCQLGVILKNKQEANGFLPALASATVGGARAA